MVAVAQSVERRFVEPEVAGAEPVSHPSTGPAALAQLVRALPRHGRGDWFETSGLHHLKSKSSFCCVVVLLDLGGNRIVGGNVGRYGKEGSVVPGEHV
jgi:hypothetical protein